MTKHCRSDTGVGVGLYFLARRSVKTGLGLYSKSYPRVKLIHSVKIYYTYLVGHETEPTDPAGTPAPTPLPQPEEYYLRRQLSQSQRAQRRITDDLSLLMAEGDKFWYGLKCCTTIIVTILTAILLLVILRWVLYK